MWRSQNFGSGLVALGLKPGPDTLVGVYSQNNPEWVLSEYGLYSNSMVVVPLYDTLGPDASRFIINQGTYSVNHISTTCFWSTNVNIFLNDFCS